ncbi:MAG: hypothetical protein PHV11_05205 [Candidatus Bipolaricaulis sp.]|nr:hypothetical protein [Candidatus Bipolaricaulis sp.]MDD5645666.1 hypothetical protein [Candidatus Bipolaricaulis sp.]
MASSLKQVEDSFRAISTVKKRTDAGYTQWLQCGDALQWLVATSKNLMPIAAWMGSIYIYSVLVPARAMAKAPEQNAGGWSLSAPSGWGYAVSANATDPEDANIVPPLHATGSEALDQGEPIVFLRYFDGRSGKKGYPELNQHIAHMLDVHWMQERSSYSRLDERGDFDDVVPIKNDDEGTIVAVSLDALEPYMLLTDAVLVRLFEVPRAERWGDILGKKRSERAISNQGASIHARLVTFEDANGPAAAKLRGLQIIKRSQTDKALLAVLKGDSPQPQQYESFIAWDFKNQRIHACSSNPARLGNYFIQSELPYETSPAFFSSEVLARYKQDPDKYRIEDRVISCRGGWYLQYDINDEGQVHAYLVDLSRLPHAEQLYWRAFNETPRSGISQRAYTTDFLGEWDEEYDPLVSLKQRLAEFPATGSGLALWVTDESTLSRLTHVVTESRKEWEDAILNLAKLVVDGFQSRTIGQIANRLGCRDKRLGSIKQLASCLNAAGVGTGAVSTVMEPLGELWSIRSRGGIAHRGSTDVAHTKAHFRGLLTRCDRAVEQLGGLVAAGFLDREASPRGAK